MPAIQLFGRPLEAQLHEFAVQSAGVQVWGFDGILGHIDLPSDLAGDLVRIPDPFDDEDLAPISFMHPVSPAVSGRLFKFEVRSFAFQLDRMEVARNHDEDVAKRIAYYFHEANVPAYAKITTFYDAPRDYQEFRASWKALHPVEFDEWAFLYAHPGFEEGDARA